MNNRHLKTVLVGFVSLGALLWFIQNLANLEQAYQSVAYVTSNADHVAYPKSFGPTFTSPVLIWIALAIILAGELATALVAGKGTYDLFRALNGSAAEFNAAKRYGSLGAGLAVVVWFGIFGIIGGAGFQMWQTEIGHGSFADGLLYAIANGVVLVFLNQPDD